MQALVLMLGMLTGGSALALVAMMLRLGTATQMPRYESEAPTPSEMRQHILWHSFYVNPDDPRGWVPKTSGYGWTVNFRTRRNAAIFATLIAVCLTSAVAMAVAALSCS